MSFRILLHKEGNIGKWLRGTCQSLVDWLWSFGFSTAAEEFSYFLKGRHYVE